ncbi:hypothetical protein [Pseudidiomarina aestuarii]|uniref:hypothetical protein n=1 Tax=Pseudidiomarina aestuarii TaxID=624146 RepID=UPI003A96EF83
MRALKAERRKLVQLYAQSQQELSKANDRAKKAQREANRSHVELVQLQNSIAYPFHYGHHEGIPKDDQETDRSAVRGG